MKTIVSTNVGNGFSKAISNNYLGEGQRKPIVFPSVAALEQGAVKFKANLTDNGSAPDLIIEFRGEKWALGEAAFTYGRMQQVDMSRARIESKMYLLMYVTTLAATVRNGGRLAVVASLPLDWYNGDREKARQILSGEFTVKFAGKTITFRIDPQDCHIVPEGFPALCNRVLTSDGRVADPDMGKARVGVVDIGTRTVQLLRVDKLQIISAKSDMRDPLGMSTVWTLLRESINQQYGRSLGKDLIDEALRNRYFKDAGQIVDVGDLCDRAIEALAMSITGEINSLWDNGREIDYLYLTGGGADLVAPWLTYSNVIVSDCGYFDNAEGGLRFALARGFGND